MKQFRLKKKKKLVIVARTNALSARMGDDTRKLSHDHDRRHASPCPRGERPRSDPDARSRAAGPPRNRSRRLGARRVRCAGGRVGAARGIRHLSPARPARHAAHAPPHPRRFDGDVRPVRSCRQCPRRWSCRAPGRGSRRSRAQSGGWGWGGPRRRAPVSATHLAHVLCVRDRQRAGAPRSARVRRRNGPGTWEPRASFRRDDGSLAPAALTTLLDEAAFWLGALATGESGMTTELRVSLHRPAQFAAPVTVTGARGAVHQRGDDARYWETDVVARADGEVVATARITYVAVRGAARRLVTGMLAMNDPACVRRVFPAYTC